MSGQRFPACLSAGLATRSRFSPSHVCLCVRVASHSPRQICGEKLAAANPWPMVSLYRQAETFVAPDAWFCERETTIYRSRFVPGESPRSNQQIARRRSGIAKNDAKTKTHSSDVRLHISPHTCGDSSRLTAARVAVWPAGTISLHNIVGLLWHA